MNDLCASLVILFIIDFEAIVDLCLVILLDSLVTLDSWYKLQSGMTFDVILQVDSIRDDDNVCAGASASIACENSDMKTLMVEVMTIV